MKNLFLSLLLVCGAALADNPQLIKASPPLTLINGFMGIPQANGTTNGFLSAADWTNFNNKLSPTSSPVFQNVTITSATPNTIAMFDGIGTLISVADTPAVGKFLTYNGTNYVWQTVATTTSWGGIIGTLSNQTDLQNALNAKANLSGAAFTGSISATNLSGTNTGDVTIGTANGLSLAGQALSLHIADATHTGALTSADWNTFNNKASLSGATFTGTVSAPTFVVGTDFTTSGSVVTTDSTPAALYTLAMTDNTAYMCESRISMGRTDGLSPGLAGFKLSVTASRQNAGPCVVAGVPTSEHSVATGGPFSATYVCSSNDLLLQVTGADSSTLDWHATVSCVSSDSDGYVITDEVSFSSACNYCNLAYTGGQRASCWASVEAATSIPSITASCTGTPNLNDQLWNCNCDSGTCYTVNNPFQDADAICHGTP